MITYTYKCNSCEKAWEIQRKISESNCPVTCPDCGQEAEQVITTANAFVLNGSGWFKKGS